MLLVIELYRVIYRDVFSYIAISLAISPALQQDRRRYRWACRGIGVAELARAVDDFYQAGLFAFNCHVPPPASRRGVRH